MSTRHSLLNQSLRFDPTGNCYPAALSDVIAGNDNGVAIAFKEASTGWLRGLFELPESWTAKTVQLVVVWTATATTNNVDWHFRYKVISGNDTSVMDIALTTTTDEGASGAYLSSIDAAPSVAKERLTTFFALTESFLVADGTMIWELQRDSADADDTMNATAVVLDVLLDVV